MRSQLLLFTITASLFLYSSPVFSQKFLVLDKYGKKRIRLYTGDEIYFKQKQNDVLFHDFLGRMQDSTITLAASQLDMELKEFDSFYFRRDGLMAVSYSTYTVGGGFVLAAAVHPLVSNAFYDQGESLGIGLSFLAFGQLLRLFKWKKFRLNNKSRIRILDTTY